MGIFSQFSPYYDPVFMRLSNGKIKGFFLGIIGFNDNSFALKFQLIFVFKVHLQLIC